MSGNQPPGVRPLAAFENRGLTPRVPLAALVVAALVAACSSSALPHSLADGDYWSLIGSLSEPAGRFDVSDNLVSNEPMFVENVRRLRADAGVYIGVGPEQNFSYIARVRPAMAFIVDIRRENLALHLLYKALFELSNDRADFLSRLFSRPRPTRLDSASTVSDIFEQFERATPSQDLYERTLASVRDRLTTTRGMPANEDDFASIERALMAFRTDGPAIDFWRGRPKDPEALRPSYRQLMTGRDVTGASRSFLATEEAFAFVKALHTRNLIVPAVGDFGGPTAIRRIGDYVRARGAVVQTFYASNVSVYLSKDHTRAFCASLATLPLAPRATFVDRDDVRPLADRLATCRSDPSVTFQLQ